MKIPSYPVREIIKILFQIKSVIASLLHQHPVLQKEKLSFILRQINTYYKLIQSIASKSK